MALWKFAAKMNSGIAKCIEKYQTKADMNAADLKEFNLDEFETHEDAFRNLLPHIDGGLWLFGWC